MRRDLKDKETLSPTERNLSFNAQVVLSNDQDQPKYKITRQESNHKVLHVPKQCHSVINQMDPTNPVVGSYYSGKIQAQLQVNRKRTN